MAKLSLKSTWKKIATCQGEGDFAEALNLVDAALHHYPGHPGFLTSRAELIQLLDSDVGPDLDDARQSLRQAVESDPHSPNPRTELGNFLFAVDDKTNEALEHFV